MKKLMRLVFVLCLLVFGTQVAFANSDKATFLEGADITGIHRLALAKPLYIPSSNLAPTMDQLIQIEGDASKVARMYVIPYPTAAESVKTDTQVDILALDRHQAAKVFKDNASKYADAYVVLTVANDSRTSFFFDVYKAGTNELLYTYQIQANRSEKDSVATYQNFCEQFYKNFERSIADQQKDNDKAEKKAK